MAFGGSLFKVCLGSEASVYADWMTGDPLGAMITLIGDQADYPPTAFATDEVHLTRAVPVRLTLQIIGAAAGVAARHLWISRSCRRRTTMAVQPLPRAGEDMAEHSRRPLIPLLILLVLARRRRVLLVVGSPTEPTGSASGAVEAQQYQVASVIAGRVTRSQCRRRRREAGQTLVVLDPVSAEAAGRSAEQEARASRRHSATPRTVRKPTSQQLASTPIKPRPQSILQVQLGYATVPPHSGVGHRHD